jgi:hypothetical protein
MHDYSELFYAVNCPGLQLRATPIKTRESVVISGYTMAIRLMEG